MEGKTVAGCVEGTSRLYEQGADRIGIGQYAHDGGKAGLTVVSHVMR